MFNSSLTLRPGEQCTQDVLSGQVSLFSLLTGDPTSVTVDDLTVVVNSFSASFVPVYNQTSNKPSEAAPLGAWLWLRVCSTECVGVQRPWCWEVATCAARLASSQNSHCHCCAACLTLPCFPL